MQTRSITRSMIAKDIAIAPLKTDVLKTPGIVSQIAKHFDEDDETLVSLFLTINDERFREELLPYCQSFQNSWSEMIARNEQNHKEWLQKLEQERQIEQIKKCLMRNIKAYMDIVDRCEGYLYKKIAMIGMYEYICDSIEALPHLGKKIGKAVGNNIYRAMDELEDDDEEFYLTMMHYEENLNDYLNWAFEQ